MSLYIGPVYFRDADFFLIGAFVLSVIAIVQGYSLPLFDAKTFVLLTIIFLLARAVLPLVHSSLVYILFLAALFLSVYVNLATVFLFMFISFVLLHLTKQI